MYYSYMRSINSVESPGSSRAAAGPESPGALATQGPVKTAPPASAPPDPTALLAAADALARSVPGSVAWPAERRAGVIAVLDRAMTTLASARAQLLVVEREHGPWAGSGERSFAAARGKATRQGERAAAAELRRGEALTTMPGLRDAVGAGRVSLEHVDVLARLAATAPPSVRDALAAPGAVAELVETAGRVDAGRFARAAAAWAAQADHAAAEAGHQDARAARFLSVAQTATGARISGRLDPVAGHRLALALEAVIGKPGPDDARSREQRNADALDAMVGAALAEPPRADGAAGRRPHVSLVMTLPAWRGLRDRARARAGARPGGRRTSEGDRSAWQGAPSVTFDDGTPAPDSEAARALCDCELTRVVVDERSEPLDVGRTTRSHTPAQRRAVTARDKGCLWPECTTPARWCEVHHLVWWDRDGGATTVVDGALVCSFHHHEIHRRDLVVTRFTCPADLCPDGTSRVRYVITAPAGRVLADGRPHEIDGRAVGRPERTWIPGEGARTGDARTSPPRDSPPRDAGADLGASPPKTVTTVTGGADPSRPDSGQPIREVA